MVTKTVDQSPPIGAIGIRREEEPARPRVLILYDVDDSHGLLVDALADRGCEVLRASDPEGVLALAGSGMPDAILLGVAGPGFDGLEVCRRLKASPGLPTIPVIMVSSAGGMST